MEAQEYEKLIKALRICSSELNCGDCPLLYRDSCSSDELMADAAAAIEALLKENKELIEDHPEMVEADGHWEWRKPNGEVLMPKRGEWINSKERMRPDMCSVCGCVYEADRFMDKIAWNYCPNCGAKMGGTE